MICKNLKTMICLLVMIQFTSCSQSGKKDGTKEEDNFPNIVYVLADDLGYGDIEIYNPESKIPTPNLDELALNGLRFTDAHSNSAVCTPTRYGTITGRYSFRTRLKSGVLWGYSPPLISPDRETVASFLKKNGYTTACIGKWHLGLEWVKKDTSRKIPDIRWDDKVTPSFDDNIDYSKPVADGPSDHGFDYSYIIPASLDMIPYLYLLNGKAVEAPTAFTEGKSEKEDGRGVFWRAGTAAPGFDFNEVLPNFIDTACNYIKSHANQEKPFFLYLALPAPHTPWLPAQEYKGKSGAGRYGDFVVMVDDMVGKVIQTIEGMNISDNTLIIMTSDNGADWRPSDIEKYGHRANYIFKGRKADIYEGGHRIPYIARWDGVIKEGTTSDETMCSTDLMATVAGMINQPLPEGDGEDSFNFWPVFIGQSFSSPIRNATIHHSLDGFFAIRKGNWKFTPHRGSGGFTEPALIIPAEDEAPGTLYNLEEDPQERFNLYKENPDIVSELSELLEQIKN